MIKVQNPPPLEVFLTLMLGQTILRPYYQNFINGLDLNGNEKILDFGSGSGVCSRHIANQLKKGGQLDCLDISEVWQSVIRTNLKRFTNVNYHLGQITDVDLPDKSYDMVVAHFVFHEIPNTACSAVMNSIAKKLKPSGRLVIREPHGHNLEIADLKTWAQVAGLKEISIQSRNIMVIKLMECIFYKI